MHMNYCAQSDKVSIVIPVPKSLQSAIEVQRRIEGKTKRDLYLKALRDFIGMHEGQDRRRMATPSLAKERRKDHSLVDMATYKYPDAPKLRIWADKPLADRVAELAKRACVSRRAFAYTAICNAFYNPQETPECREFQ